MTAFLVASIAAVVAATGLTTVLGPPTDAGASVSTIGGSSTRSPGGDTTDHSCITPGSPVPAVDWPAVVNPVLTEPNAGVKDEAITWVDGRWHLLASYLTGTDTTAHWHIAAFTSRDLVHWTAPAVWPHQAGALGVASPDIVRDPAGTFVVTYQSDPGEVGGRLDQLYYRTSRDLIHFSPPHRLAPGLAERMIDGALVYTSSGVILGYKAGVAGQSQSFRIAWSPSGSLRGPWREVGAPDITVNGGTVENYEFVFADDAWRLVATSNNLDQPWLFTLRGNPAQPTGWLQWDAGRELQVPAESWDHGQGLSSLSYEQDNSAFLCVDGSRDLLFYAGSSELTHFGGWGHASVGVAMSSNLVDWVPADPRPLHASAAATP